MRSTSPAASPPTAARTSSSSRRSSSSRSCRSTRSSRRRSAARGSGSTTRRRSPSRTAWARGAASSAPRERALGRELAEVAHDHRAELIVVGSPVESRRGFRRAFPPSPPDPARRAVPGDGRDRPVRRRHKSPRRGQTPAPQHELERVLGANALFATAYGNVGSSIYYALGVIAFFALGLTPLVFVIAGLFFAATAATYAEGTVRYPEAGGSSSFARHAFNELVSFGAAWAQMLNYVITIAISAFFVPHYLSIFWGPLRENPWDIIGGAIVIVVLVALNIVGIQESARINVVLAAVDFATQVLLVAARLRPRLQPAHAARQHPLRRRADVVELPARDPGGDDRLHGDRDRLEPVGGGARPGPEHSALDQDGRGRRLRDLLHAADDRALGDAGAPRRRELPDGARPAAGEGRVRQRPGARPRRAPRHHGHAALGDQGLRRPPRRDDPLHRDERRRDRRVADHVRDGRVSAAPRGVPQAASALQDAVAVADRVRRARPDPRAAAREDEVPQHDVLVRRDALVHGRARRGDPAAPAPPNEELAFRARRTSMARSRLAAVRDLRRAGTALSWLDVVIQYPSTRYAGFVWLASASRDTSSIGAASALPLAETVRAPV